MSDIFLQSIPTHLCEGQNFDSEKIEKIYHFYCQIKRKEVECNQIFRKLSPENKMVGLDHFRLNRILNILKQISHYHSFIKIIMLDSKFSPRNNCVTCNAELRLSIDFVIKKSQKKSKEIKQKFLEYAYYKILHL